VAGVQALREGLEALRGVDLGDDLDVRVEVVLLNCVLTAQTLYTRGELVER
jgi:hypothetical protein